MGCFVTVLLLIDSDSIVCKNTGRKLAQQMNLDRRRHFDDSMKSDLMTVMLNIGRVSKFNPKRAVELWAQEMGNALRSSLE